MFTIGIFSTHLPYIAFVFFYAFFFFINIQNNPEDTIVKKESANSLTVVCAAETEYYNTGTEQAGQSYYATIRQNSHPDFPYDELSGSYHIPDEPLIKGEFYSANFSRPPPSV